MNQNFLRSPKLEDISEYFIYLGIGKTNKTKTLKNTKAIEEIIINMSNIY